MSTQPYALYNPAMLAPEQLLAEFSARQTTLERLVDVVRNNQPGHPPQHALVCGPRGMGKTTLLWAVAHTIALREPELAAQWQPVPFDEESRRIGDLADFWLESIRQWEVACGSTGDTADGLLDLPPGRIEDAARQCFLKLVDVSGKRALLLVDNVNEVFRNVDNREALHRLRAFLMDDDRVMLLGACVELSDDVTSIEKPFFDFFRIFELKPLTFEEVRDCLYALADARGDAEARAVIDKREGGLRAIHLLTGGNPRLVKTFYRLLKDGLHRDIRVDLEKLLDEFTPYFKAIVDALSTQQQRIFDAVALAWNPVEVAHVARQTRLASNKVSSQLRYMIRSGHIAEVAGQPKKKSYMLADRFSNVHYLMRHGRAARIRFDWFVVMVRLLFEDEEYAKALAVMAKDSVIGAPPGWDEACGLVANAMDRAETPKARKLLIGQFVTAQNPESIADLQLAEIACNKALEIDPNDADAHFKKGRVEEYLSQDARKAAASYSEAVRINPAHVGAWGALAWVNHRLLHDEKAAEAAYRKALEIDPEAWWIRTNYGSFLQEHTTRYDEAEREFRTVCEKDPEPNRTWFNLGNLLKNYLKRPDEAEMAYLTSIKANETYAPPVMGLALLYRDQGKDPSVYGPLAVKAMNLPPYRSFDLWSFFSLCGKDKDAICQVLPALCHWCAGHSEHVDLTMVYSFAFTLWMRLADLFGPDESLDLMSTMPEADLKPFEALSDVFHTQKDPSHLHRLAPERARFVTELLAKGHPKEDEERGPRHSAIPSIISSFKAFSAAMRRVGRLWDPREFREIRFPFLEEGLFPFAAFLAHVVEQGGVAGEIEQAHLAVAVGVEGGLEAAQGERRVGEHFAAPLEGFLFEIGERDDGVDEAHVERLLGVVLAAEIPDFAGFFLADDAGEVAGAEAAIERTDLRAGLAETGVVRGDGEIADDVQHVAAADRVAGDHGDDGLRQGADFFLQDRAR